MELLGRVRRMHYRDGLSRSEIARRTGLTRNTVKKWLTAPEAVEPRYRRSQAQGKLAPFTAAAAIAIIVLPVPISALRTAAGPPASSRRQVRA